MNGDAYELAGPMTISALLAQLHIDPRIVAVEHNVTVVKRDRYESTVVNDGDEVEIVRFVGGGAPTNRCSKRQRAAKQRRERERALAGRGGGAPRQN